MKRIAFAASVVLLLSCAAYAATPSAASLKGAYAFQSSRVQTVYWGKTVSATCFAITYTMWLGGQSTGTRVDAGVITFSGTGTFSINVTQYGDFDQADSNNTVSITCTGNPKQPYTTNSGYPVFYPSSAITDTGSYTVGATGIGTFDFTGGKPDEAGAISLGQYNSSGLAGVVLMRQVLHNNGELSTGIAILQ